MEKKKEAFDYEVLKKKPFEQGCSCKGDAFAPFLKDFLEAALHAELEEDLADEAA